MNKEEVYYPIKIRTKRDQLRGDLSRLLSRRYIWLAFLSYLFITLLVLLYLLKSPSFESTMSLVLPGSGSSSNFSVEDVGQATSQTKSPFSGGGFSPQVNYKEILKSRDVVIKAAKTIGVDATQFGKPRVDLTQQTSILTVKITAGSAILSARKARALYDAFQVRLDELRLDESLRYTEGVERALRQYEIKLAQKRQRVVDFQQNSLVVSGDQMQQILKSISEIEEKIMYAQSELSHKQAFVRQLSHDLGVSPLLAGKAFELNTDSQFRGYLRELDESAAMLSQYSSHWGSKHPKVKVQQARFDAAKKSLLNRSSQLIGKGLAELLHTIDLSSNISRQTLFADLVEAFAQVQGDKAMLSDLDVSIRKMHDRLKIYTREIAELERLEREYRLAEAVYTSAAARLDAGKADVFASYPVIQLLTPPMPPLKQKSPKKALAVAAWLGGFFFITLGLLVLWQRHFLISQLLKKS